MEIQTLLQQVTPALTVQQRAGLHAQLSAFLNRLIQSDFEKLVQLLYRIDVDEKRLKSLLQQNQQADAAGIIANLVIERQLQKWAARQQLNTGAATDDEKW